MTLDINFFRKLHKNSNTYFEIGKDPTDPQKWPKGWAEILYKEYPRFPRINLSTEYPDLGSLENSLKKRKSIREFDRTQPISFEEFSAILAYSAGIRPPDDNERKLVRKYYPSGGARYPLETYLGIQNVSGIDPGIYHYNVKEHSIELLTDNEEDLTNLYQGLLYPWSRDAAFIHILTACWRRSFLKYKGRAYRLILLEAGHATQNLALVCSALGIGSCQLLGFHNEYTEKILDISNEEEDTLYASCIGR